MSERSNFIFKALRIVAWVIFVGLSVEAGGLIVNFIFSIYKPEFVPNLYQKLDLSNLHNNNEWGFYSVYSFILIISILKAYLFYLVIELISKFDLEKPFNYYIANQVTKISYFTFSIGIVSYIGRQTANDLAHDGFAVNSLGEFWADSQAFILMAGIVYVIATIISRGVEIQNEHDLTI